jgi:thymidine phosphorylase
VLCGIAADAVMARKLAEAKLADGSAAEVFARMVFALGGPAGILENPWALPRSLLALPVAPSRPGIVTAIDARAIGLAVIGLGGGRTRADQEIDPRVGFSAFTGIGETVDASHPICFVHAGDDAAYERAAAAVRAAVTAGDAAPAVGAVVRERVG